MKVGKLIVVGLAIGLSSGCYEGGAAPAGETQLRELNLDQIPNGFDFGVTTVKLKILNGIKIYGGGTWVLNGLRFGQLGGESWTVLNGVELGTRFKAPVLNGYQLSAFGRDGTVLNGTYLDQGEVVEVSGEELIGAVMQIDLLEYDDDDNLVEVPIELRIDDFYQDPNALFDDVFVYDLSYRFVGADDDNWYSPCEDSEGVDHPAMVLENSWDVETGDRIDAEGVVSFACTNGVLAHCVEWGYRPWATAEHCDDKKGKKGKNCEEVSLRDYHQACTRMARADYCGTGEPWTVEGTALDIWDDLDPQIHTRFLGWEMEAEWTPDGAWCLNDIRQQGWKEEGLYPVCGETEKQQKRWEKTMKRRARKCGKLKSDEALIASSFEPVDD